MADNTIEVILKASAQGFPETVKTAEQSLKNLGTAAGGATQQLKSTATAGEGLGNILERSLFKSIGALSLIGAAAMEIRRGFSAAVEYIQSAIAYTTQFESEVNSLAIELSALGTTGGKGFAQDLQYATAANEQLRASVLGLGGDITGAERLFHAFVAARIVPDTQQGINAIAQLQLVLSTMVTSRRPMMTIQQEMLQLLDGEVNKQNQIANILERKLHLSDEQLKSWVQQGIEQGNLAEKMATALSPGTDALEHWRTLLPQIQMHSKELGDEIKRAGMKEAYQDITRAATDYDQYLQTHKESLIAAHRSIAEAVGAITLAWNKAKIALTEYLGAALSGRGGGFGPAPGTEAQTRRGLAAQYEITHPVPQGPALAKYLEDESKFINAAIASAQTTKPSIPGPADRPTKATDQPGWGQKGGGGGGKSAFEIARDQIDENAAHLRAMAEVIDSNATREAAIAAILAQESSAYATLATHADTAAHAEEARKRSAELNVQAIVAQRQAARDLVMEQVQSSREFIANQQALGQMSTADALAAHQRVLSRLQGQAAAGGLRSSEAAKQAMQEETTIRNLHRQALEERIQDAQTFIAREVDINGVGITEQIADWQRLLAWLQTQHGPGVEAAVRGTMDRIVKLNREAVDQQLADDKRVFDQQRESLTSSFELARISTEAARAMRGIPMGPQVSAGPGGLSATAASRSTAEVSASIQAVADAREQVALAQQLQAADQDRLAKLQDELAAARDIVTQKQIQAQIDETLKQFGQDKLAAARAELDVLKAQVDQYNAMMKPITDASHAVSQSMESDIAKALDSALVGDGTKHAYTFWNAFRDIGRSIISQVTGMVSQALMQSLNIGPTLNALFGKAAGALGIVNPQQAQQLLANITLENSTVTRMNTEALNALTSAMRGGTSGGGGTGPFTNIPGVPAASGGPFGPVGEIGGMIGGPIGRAANIVASAGGLFGGLFGGGTTGSLILRAMGGLVPGPLIPVRAFADGGVASGPIFSMVGEGGPEAVIPLRSGKVPVDLGRGGGGHTFIFNVQTIDAQSFQSKMYEHRGFFMDLLDDGYRSFDGATRRR